jgi:hypothetical protein
VTLNWFRQIAEQNQPRFIGGEGFSLKSGKRPADVIGNAVQQIRCTILFAAPQE